MCNIINKEHVCLFYLNKKSSSRDQPNFCMINTMNDSNLEKFWTAKRSQPRTTQWKRLTGLSSKSPSKISQKLPMCLRVKHRNTNANSIFMLTVASFNMKIIPMFKKCNFLLNLIVYKHKACCVLFTGKN